MLIDCLETLLPELHGINTKIIVVDDFSQYGTVQFIQKWASRQAVGNLVTLVASSENSGFSGGNNTGITEVEAEFFLCFSASGSF